MAILSINSVLNDNSVIGVFGFGSFFRSRCGEDVDLLLVLDNHAVDPGSCFTNLTRAFSALGEGLCVMFDLTVLLHSEFDQKLLREQDRLVELVPSGILTVAMSQAHNYFIHRLINQHDLTTIASAVSYIDKMAEESIPTLPTGTCVFSGVAAPMPLKINVKALPTSQRPQSATREFSRSVVPALGL